jgi:cytochrome c biogenesis factor
VIAGLGLAALWLAAALAGLQLVAGTASLRSDSTPLAVLVRPAAMVQGLLAALAFAALMVLFWQTDLSLVLVAAHSHSAKSGFYRLADSWTNRDGALLLLVAVIGLGGGLLALAERRPTERTMQAALAVQAAIGMALCTVLLLAANPFARIARGPAQGAALDPLLQSAAFALHIPALYIGYAGLAVAFALTAGAVLTQALSPVLARTVRPWALCGWIGLTLGIAARSYWHHAVLGTGAPSLDDMAAAGPVIAWLAATALLHAIGVLAARGTWPNGVAALCAAACAAAGVAALCAAACAAGGVAAMAGPAILPIGGGSAGIPPVWGTVLAGLGAGLFALSLWSLRRCPLRMATLPHWGAALAHAGLALALGGAAWSAAFSAERAVRLRAGDSVSVGGWTVTLRTITPIAGPNWTALEAQLDAGHDDARSAVLRPQSRTFWKPLQQIARPDRETRWNGQLTTVLGDQDADGRWPLTLRWKPFVALIWYGGLLAAVGGMLALSGHLASDIRRLVARDKIAYRRMRQGR